jgi:hypothetical protein
MSQPVFGEISRIANPIPPLKVAAPPAVRKFQTINHPKIE